MASRTLGSRCSLNRAIVLATLALGTLSTGTSANPAAAPTCGGAAVTRAGRAMAMPTATCRSPPAANA